MRIVRQSTAVATRQNLLKALWAVPLVLVPAGSLASGADAGGRAIAAAIADPMSIFAARSPGKRAAGALTQTKSRASAGPAGARPTERVLAGVRSRPAAAPAIPALVGPIDGIVPGASPFVLPVNAGGGALGPIGPSGPVPVFGGVGGTPIVFGGGGPGGGGGSGGGGGGGGTGTTPGTPVVPVPIVPDLSAVPEPAAWLMMIAGFMSIGTVLRFGRRQPRLARLRPDIAR